MVASIAVEDEDAVAILLEVDTGGHRWTQDVSYV